MKIVFTVFNCFRYSQGVYNPIAKAEKKKKKSHHVHEELSVSLQLLLKNQPLRAFGATPKGVLRALRFSRRTHVGADSLCKTVMFHKNTRRRTFINHN